MNTTAFLFAAVIYFALTVFVFFNYPESWRKNRLFVTVLLLWHVLGLAAAVMVFTVFSLIPYEGVRYEIARVGSCYYITTTMMAMLFLLRGISSRTYHFVMERTGRPAGTRLARFHLDKRFHAVVIIVLSFAVYTIGFFNIDFLNATRYEVTVHAKSAEPELNICLIADVHAGSGTWQYTYDDLAEQIDRADADVLLIVGDVFDETTNERDIQHFAWVLNTIRQPKYGIYYIYGNHDNYVDDWAAEQLRAMGAVVLEDEMAVIGEDIQLIGRMDPKHPAKELPQLFHDLNPDPDKPVLVLSHRPDSFREMADLGGDLAMAGHTHGFNIPQFLGLPLLEDTFYGRKEYGGMTAITTSGVSAWGFHYKFPAISEVVSIHVTFAE